MGTKLWFQTIKLSKRQIRDFPLSVESALGQARKLLILVSELGDLCEMPMLFVGWQPYWEEGPVLRKAALWCLRRLGILYSVVQRWLLQFYVSLKLLQTAPDIFS